MPADFLAQQQLKASLGRFELIAGMLQVLHFLQHFSQRRLITGDIEFLASLYKSAMTGQPVVRGSITLADPFYQRMNGTGEQTWQHKLT